MVYEKPLLTVEEQIAHLKAKGVRFACMSEKQALDYLRYHNNYFKLAAYRKNYQKHPGGAKMGQYVDLDFAYLVDLADIDRALRDVILSLALDVEHFAKLNILRLVEQNGEDGYTIVQDFIASLADKERGILAGEIARNRSNTYCGAMVQKYEQNIPVWVLLEVVSFGKLIEFYRFCANRFDNRKMHEEFYLFRMCKVLRNAAAHNSCILNDLSDYQTRIKTNRLVIQALAQMPNLTRGVRVKKMKNERLQQLATLLYTHQAIVADGSAMAFEKIKWQRFVERLEQHTDYYRNNALLCSTFDFLRLLIDNWYHVR